MLRVEIQGSPDTLILKLEGRFTGDDAEHSRSLLAHCLGGVKLVVDLTEVTFIDSVGEEVLSFFGRFGAEFVAQTSYTVDICERLHLRVARREGANGNASSASRSTAGRRRGRAPQKENEEV
jgi:STAS domain-containing protein